VHSRLNWLRRGNHRNARDRQQQRQQQQGDEHAEPRPTPTAPARWVSLTRRIVYSTQFASARAIDAGRARASSARPRVGTSMVSIRHAGHAPAPRPRSQSGSRSEARSPTWYLTVVLIALRPCNITPLCPLSRVRRYSATHSQNITPVSSQRQVSLTHAGLLET
jgi:hypothetical protein